MAIVSLRKTPFWVNSNYQTEGLKNFVEFLYSKNQDLSLWLEIGSYVGESTSIFLSYPFIKKIYCIDTWDRHPDLILKKEDLPFIKQRFCTNLKNDIELERCIPVEDSSVNAFNYLDILFDVIYIDGSHSYKDTYEDLTLWYSKLKFDGFMCGHDFTFDRNSDLYTCTAAIQDFIKSISKYATIEFHIFKDGSWAFQKLKKYF
jgi:hypothetical protein